MSSRNPSQSMRDSAGRKRKPAVPGLYLGIETSGEETALALVRGSQCLVSFRELSQARHNEMIFDMLTRLFESAVLQPGDLAGIGVSIGPGMFTSLRVGLSVAKGIALSLKVPVKGISTLDALVRTARAEVPESANRRPDVRPLKPSTRWFLSLIDARKGEVYAALYREQERVSDFQITTPRAIHALISDAMNQGGTMTILGNGARRYRDLLLEGIGERGRYFELDYPSAAVIAQEAAEWIERGKSDSVDDLSPSYLRRTDAELRRDSERVDPSPANPAFSAPKRR